MEKSFALDNPSLSRRSCILSNTGPYYWAIASGMVALFEPERDFAGRMASATSPPGRPKRWITPEVWRSKPICFPKNLVWFNKYLLSKPILTHKKKPYSYAGLFFVPSSLRMGWVTGVKTTTI